MKIIRESENKVILESNKPIYIMEYDEHTIVASFKPINIARINWNDLRSQELEQKKKLDKYGLVRVIEHDIFGIPVHPEALGIPLPEHMNNEEVNHIIAKTTVYLFEKDVWEMKRKVRSEDTEGYVSVGYSFCSEMEKQHSRAKGRLIATARALESFEATLERN